MENRQAENRQAATGAGLYTVSRLIAAAFDILLVVALTRFLTQDVFGLFAFVFMVQITIRAVGTLGLLDALIYYIPKLGDHVARSMGIWCGLVLFLVSLPFGAVFGFGNQTLAVLFGRPEIAPFLGYLAIFIIADLPAETLPRYLLARRAYLPSFAVEIVFSGGRFLSLVLPAWLGADSITILFWFVVVAWLRFSAYLIYFSFIASGPVRKTGWQLSHLFSFGLPLAASNIVSRLNLQLDKYMIFLLLPPAIYGVYAVGAQEIPLVSSIAYSVTAALLPTLTRRHSQGDIQSFLELWHASMIKVATLLVPIFFLCIILAGPLMRILYSPAFGMAALPFAIYMFLLPLRLCAYGGIVRTLGLSRPVLVSTVIGLVVNAALNYPLYLLFGLAGPGIASVIAQFVTITWLLSIIRKNLDLTWLAVFPYSRWFKVVMAGGLATVPMILLLLFVEQDITRLVLGTTLYGPSYLFLSWKLGLVTFDDILFIANIFSLGLIKKKKPNLFRAVQSIK